MSLGFGRVVHAQWTVPLPSILRFEDADAVKGIITRPGVMRSWLDRNQGKLQASILKAWKHIGAEVVKTKPEYLGGRYQIPREWEQAIINGYAGWAVDALVPSLLGAIHTAGKRTRDGMKSLDLESELPAEMIADGWVWAGGVDALREWTKTRSGKLISDLTLEELQSIRDELYRYTKVDPRPWTYIAQQIRQHIGNLDRDIEVQRRMRAALAEDGVAPAQIEKVVERYAAQQLRRRSQTIARTELAEAWHTGQQESIRQGLATGEIVGTIVKEWLAANDERTCSICGALHGEQVELDEDFPGGYPHPPAHPNCVCDVIHRTKD